MPTTVAVCEKVLGGLGWRPVPYVTWGGRKVRCYENPRGGIYTLQEALDRSTPGTRVDPDEWTSPGVSWED
jgi:hypothetical protein